MYTLTLMGLDDAEVATRRLEAGHLSVGRDPSADWVVPDTEGLVSRVHCLLELRGPQVLVTDRSTNGTFLPCGARAPRDVAVPVAAGSRLRFGPYSLLVEEEAPAGTRKPAPLAPTAPIRSPEGWADAPRAIGANHPDASLVEAFCAGADLDPSEFSSEDPVELMRRVGAVYQQTVIGLATLMSERARFKTDHDLERTTIGPMNNNPFKWTPTRKLAQDLLRGRRGPFLSDAAAVRACFGDLAGHMSGLVHGANAGVAHLLNALDPDQIEEDARPEVSLLRRGPGLFWARLRARREALLGSGSEGDHEAAPLREAFNAGYAEGVAACAEARGSRSE